MPILSKRTCKDQQFLTKEGFQDCRRGSKIVGGVGYISLQHMCSIVKRAEALVRKCCCKDSKSWLEVAIMSVDIREECMAIVLDLHLWRMLLDFAITLGRGVSREKKAEEMRIMDEKYHGLWKDLHLETHALQQAAIKDKEATILNSSRIAEIYGPSNGVDYLRSIYMQSLLAIGASITKVELTKWDYVEFLGHGGCGVVNKVKWLGFDCALKLLVGQDEKEATTLKGLFHPNIIRLLHYWEDCHEDPQSRLLMELMPKDLGGYMKDRMKSMSSSKPQEGKHNMPFSLPVAIDIMYQVAQAMRYMHDQRLAHRDLKPSNILVKERSTCNGNDGYLDIKLADFGLVKAYTHTSTFQAHSGSKGTGWYRAPEMFGKNLSQQINYLQMADVWSFGITCVEILSGKGAYAKEVDKYGFALQAKVCKEGLKPTLPKHCPDYLAFCINSCWEYSPSRRPPFASLCKLLRHAKLLSLGVTHMDDSKYFFAYLTRSGQVRSLNSLEATSSKGRISTLFQSSLKLMGIGPLPTTSIGEEQVVSTTMVAEERPLTNEVGIVTLGESIEIVNSFPNHGEHVQQSQASTDNAIPLRQVVGARQLFAEMHKMDEMDVVIPLENNQSFEFENRNSSHGDLFSVVQERLEGRSVELAVIGGLKAMAASNFPSALGFTLESHSITLPKSCNPPNVEDLERNTAPSSSSPVNHNNDSLDLKGYPLEAPPQRSHQDDDTGPCPTNLSMAVVGVRTSVKHFAALLTSNMTEYREDYEHLNVTILREFYSVRHNPLGYLVQAFVSKRLFDGFNALNGYFGVKSFANDPLPMTKLSALADFSKFKDTGATISMLLDSNSSDGSFLGHFCLEKFLSIFSKLAIYPHEEFTIDMHGGLCFKESRKNNILGKASVPIFRQEWIQAEKGCHPKTEFYKRFLEVAVSVWLVHRLVHSFEEGVDMLIYEKGCKFDRSTMMFVPPLIYEHEDEDLDANMEVQFSVIPGFQMSGSVVKCKVFTRENCLPDLEITGGL